MKKIYLDTSVVSCLYAPETPERQADTREFWKRAENGEFEIMPFEPVERAKTVFDVDEIHEVRVRLAKEYASMPKEEAERLHRSRVDAVEARIQEARRKRQAV